MKKLLRRFILWIRKSILGIDDRSQLEIALANGLVMGKNCKIMPEVILDPSHCWLIELGDNVTMAPRVHVLAHDASTKQDLGYTKIGRVTIGNNVFVGAGTLILPNVTIGDNVVIGARSVVTKDIPSNSVAVGSPAKVTGTYDEYIKKNRELLANSPVFDESYQIDQITDEKKAEMRDKLKTGIGFIV